MPVIMDTLGRFASDACNCLRFASSADSLCGLSVGRVDECTRDANGLRASGSLGGKVAELG